MHRPLALCALVLLVAGCAHQPPPPEVLAGVPGFFSGVLHGLTAPLSLMASLYYDVRVYAFPNTGPLYDLGFLGGATFSLGVTWAVISSR